MELPQQPHQLDYATPPKQVQRPRQRSVAPAAAHLTGLFGILMLYQGVVLIAQFLRSGRIVSGQDVLDTALVFVIAIACLAIGFRPVRRPRRRW